MFENCNRNVSLATNSVSVGKKISNPSSLSVESADNGLYSIPVSKEEKFNVFSILETIND